MNTGEQLAAEAHHRVQNTLQNIVSYLNVMTTSGDGSLSKEDVRKLIGYVKTLSSLHSVLFEEVRSQGNPREIRLSKMIEHVVAANELWGTVQVRHLPEIVCTPRRAATVSLVLNELISLFAQNGSTDLALQISERDHEVVELELRCQFPNGRTIEEGSSLRLARLLAKSDLESDIELVQSAQAFCSKFSFPREAFPSEASYYEKSPSR